MRTRMRAVLANCDPSLAPAAARRILQSGLIRPGWVVAGFWPLGSEIDITPLLRQLRATGHVVALPHTPPRGEALSFRRWAMDDTVTQERFGTMTSSGPAVDPDLLLVPLLAFDRRGHRLGYGGGYYDRTLAARPGIRTIGCAYAAQEWPNLPVTTTDVALQHIATEQEWITA